jgi:uncharacterized protein YkwD
MKSKLAVLLLFSSLSCLAQSSEAAPYLAEIGKYNEASNFEDVRYQDLDWKGFYKLEEANELVDAVNYDFDLMNAAIFYAVNKYRSSKGIQELRFDPMLRDAASIHSYEMVTKNFFDHTNYQDPKLKGPDTRMELCGYLGQKLAENLCRSYVDSGHPMTYTQVADRVIAELSKSKEHNRHLLDPEMEKLGCGVIFERVPEPGGIFYFRLTQDYGRDRR